MVNDSSLRLFDVDEASGYKMMLNKDWLFTIPQFHNLIKADKGSEGDYRGDKKLKAIAWFTFIYHMEDPRSPLENADIKNMTERRAKSLAYAELKEKDVSTPLLLEALDEYRYILSIAVPTLGILRSAKGTLKKLQEHFDNIDFDARDKKGALVYSATSHIQNVKNLKALHQAIKEFDNMVMEELKQSTGIRGSATMGDRELGHRKVERWQEGGGTPYVPEDHEDMSTTADKVALAGDIDDLPLASDRLDRHLIKPEEEEPVDLSVLGDPNIAEHEDEDKNPFE